MADPNTKNGNADVNFDRIISSLFVFLGASSLLTELFNALLRQLVLGMEDNTNGLVMEGMDLVDGSFT